MNLIHKEEQKHPGLKEPVFDFFLYYLPEFSHKEENGEESKKTSKKVKHPADTRKT
ncbi:hypothetical protein ACE3NQ_17730 [Paenibacillus terreus]|uniref:Uncharacterized protein n=1 Tax=Paenibacillus terreus TaxID=1387834 RepID=A0ABV5BAM8_9BACL